MRNGSGTMTPSVDFTTEAASPPIEIAKLDTVLDDIAAEITNSIAADGQTNPSADLKMNGFKHTNVGAATALTHYGRVTEIIDQDYVYYVDSGSANTYAITPSPAIAAYEEGQRFVVRIANATSGASTLNVNGLGAIAIQTVDGSATTTGTLAAGGIYEFTYDANATPDRWVLTSPASEIADGMLSGNVALENAQNLFTDLQTITIADTANALRLHAATGRVTMRPYVDATNGFILASVNTAEAAFLPLTLNASVFRVTGNTGLYLQGTLTTDNAEAGELGTKGVPRVSKTADYTLAAVDSGTELVLTSAADDITVQATGAPVAGMVVFLENGTGGSVDIVQGSGMTLTLDGTATTGSRTLAANGRAYVRFTSASAASVGGLGVA